MSKAQLRRWSSIRSQLMLGFGIILLLHGISAVISYGSLQRLRHRSQTTLDNAAQVRELSLALKSNFLLARQAEEAYFNNWQGGKVGLNGETYRVTNQTYLVKARENLAELRKLDAHNPEVAEELALLASLFRNYEAAFATTQRRITADGQTYQIHQQLKALLTTLPSRDDSPDLTTIRMLVWQLMAQQQAYLNTQDPAYLTDLQSGLNQLSQRLNQLPVDTLDAHNQQLIQQYMTSLNALLFLDQQVQVNRIIAANVNQDINRIIQTISDRAAARSAQANADLANTANQSSAALLVTALTALVLAIWASILLGRRIITPLTLLAEAADRIAQQDLSQSLTLGGDNAFSDEFVVVAQAFNHMVSQLRYTLETLEQRVEERTEELRHQALHDALTGLPNRTLFTERLEQAVQRVNCYPDQLFAVLFIDLDRFKVVNDSLGHLVGDQLLLQIAQILQRHVRSRDTVARLGGDEFVILLEHIASLNDAIQVVERIQADMKAPFTLMGHTVFTSASLGIALASPHYTCSEDMLRDADNAMYRAKARGQSSSYAVFNTAMHESAIQLFELETSLRQALERSDFLLYYQPIVSLATRQLLGFEALVRWQHPQRGLIAPDIFIPLAEETGLIIPLSQWIFETACRQMAHWCRQIPLARGLKISLNVAAAQFEQPEFPAYLQAMLDRTALPPVHVNLEVTESLLLNHVAGVLATLSTLQRQGIEISIDDFGTGYSSLSYLKQFSINTLKIDRSFVENIDVDHDDVSIVKAIIQMAHSLGMRVIAEGVETEFQTLRLQELGCDAIQGYWVSHPLTADQAATLIHSPYIEQTCGESETLAR
jgi:diguanylate cyclase (GGDEF)-like protein